MPATKIAITDSWTAILSGSETVDQLVTCGSKPLRICVGSTSGVDYDEGTPIGSGEKIVFPEGCAVSGRTFTGETAVVWVTDFGV